MDVLPESQSSYDSVDKFKEDEDVLMVPRGGAVQQRSGD